MKYAELFEIKMALEALGKEKLPIAFELAKNLRIVNKVITETQEIAKELHGKFADRDESGEIKVYKEDDGKEISKITDAEKLKSYQEELKKLDEEEHDVTLVKITKAQIAELRNYEPVMVLLDKVIFE